jgi:prepilin signal peptidase PulO-like enzyme (type II secretory pathway)
MLRWYELFPLVSYVVLRGKCKNCRCSISPRYFFVELVTALLFLSAFVQFQVSALFLFSIVLISVLMVVAVYDLYHMVIPNQLVLVTTFLAIAYFILVYNSSFTIGILLQHVAASMASFLFYGGLWFVSKGRWIGFGDAKLSIPFGFILGPLGTFSCIIFSFWIGAIVSLLLLGLPVLFGQIQRCYSCVAVANSKKSFTMKSEIPFAPFMITAFLLVYLYQLDVLTLLSVFM